MLHHLGAPEDDVEPGVGLEVQYSVGAEVFDGFLGTTVKSMASPTLGSFSIPRPESRTLGLGGTCLTLTGLRTRAGAPHRWGLHPVFPPLCAAYTPCTPVPGLTPDSQLPGFSHPT